MVLFSAVCGQSGWAEIRDIFPELYRCIYPDENTGNKSVTHVIADMEAIRDKINAWQDRLVCDIEPLFREVAA